MFVLGIMGWRLFWIDFADEGESKVKGMLEQADVLVQVMENALL
jgi:hypothetical protein